jgi:hypothetical protein
MHIILKPEASPNRLRVSREHKPLKKTLIDTIAHAKSPLQSFADQSSGPGSKH